LESRLALSGSGLTAQYFFNPDFTGLAGTRTEAIAQNWGTESPGFGVGADHFSVRWTGQIEPQFSETYTLRLQSDEGVRLWLDGELLIDDWAAHTVRTRTATATLTAGQLYDIRVDYFDGTGAAQASLSWSSASQSLQTVPAWRLYENPAGLLGSYRDTAGGTLSRVDPGVNFNWGTPSPGAGIATNGFTVNWTGQIRADYADEYTFAATSDEGVRLWVGDELVLDNATATTTAEVLGTKWLEPGKWYDVRLEYTDSTGSAQVALKWSSDHQTGAGVYQVVPPSNLRASKLAEFENPLGAGADPWVTYWNGYYYLARSQGNAVWINRATSLEDIHQNSGRSQTIVAWSAPTGTAHSQQIWAPELHHIGNSWYIYVAASDGNNATHRMQVLKRGSSDPFGLFTYIAPLAATTDRWAIDGTAFEWNNSLYFVWSGWEGTTNVQQNLYIAQMSNPWTILGERTIISAPQFSWERNGLPINEGPEILIHDGQLHIIFSASGYWTNQYALGRLTYNGTGSLLNAASWTKATQPVFQATSLVTGPGHASFTTSPDGTENWIVYHAHANPTVFNEDRVIRMQPFEFRSDGTPNFGQPLTPGIQLPVPSRGADPERPILIGDYQADGAVNDLDYNLWRATFDTALFAGSAADGSGNGVVDAADYVLWRARNGQVADAAASASLDSPAAVNREGFLSSASDWTVNSSNQVLANSFAQKPTESVAMPTFRAAYSQNVRTAARTTRLRPRAADDFQSVAADLALADWAARPVFVERVKAPLGIPREAWQFQDDLLVSEDLSDTLTSQISFPLEWAILLQ
jgi:GH43 family beta-xylosidase